MSDKKDETWSLYYKKPKRALKMEDEETGKYAKFFSGFGKGLEFITKYAPEVKVRVAETAEHAKYHVVFHGHEAALGYAITGFIQCAGTPEHVSGNYKRLNEVLSAFGKTTKGDGTIADKFFGDRPVIDMSAQ